MDHSAAVYSERKKEKEIKKKERQRLKRLKEIVVKSKIEEADLRRYQRRAVEVCLGSVLTNIRLNDHDWH